MKTLPVRVMWITVICIAGVLLFMGTSPTFADEPTADDSAKKEKSADEIAKELANPNNSLAKLTFQNQFRWYTGDLPGADKQHNYSLLFQPIFPFNLGEAKRGAAQTLFIRPAFPILIDQPVPGIRDGRFGFDGVNALGDVGFDLAYGVTEKSGFLWNL